MKVRTRQQRLPWIKHREPFQRERDDQPFYNSTAWRKVSALRRYKNPFCEICEALGKVIPAQATDHVIRKNAGGAPLDLANTMSLCTSHHNRKSRMERDKSILVKTAGVKGEFYPARREDIFELFKNDKK